MPALATLEFSVGPVAGVSGPAKDGEDEEREKQTAEERAARRCEVGHFGSFKFSVCKF
jgi:hypothetical protein